MIIKVLGPGCINCQTLERRTREALAELGIDAELIKVTDYAGIASYNVIRMPALVIDECVVWQGGVPKVAKIKEMIVAQRAMASTT
jgi:small redox-active disulfide protein 2